MRITDLLKSTAIELHAGVTDKGEAIDKLIALHEAAGNLTDPAKFKEDILKREEHSTTAIGEGIAVPHAKSSAVKTPGLSLITVGEGVDYAAPDGKKTDLLFMIAATEDGDVHLEILSRLMVMLMDADFANAIRKAQSAEELLKLIDEKEIEKYQEEKPAGKKDGYRIL